VAKGIYLSCSSPRTCEPISVNRCRFMPKTRLPVIEMLGRHATHGDCWRYFALSETRHRTLLRMCCHGKAVACLFRFFRRDVRKHRRRSDLICHVGRNDEERSATKDKSYFIPCFSREIFLSFAFFARRMARGSASRRLHRAISFRFVTLQWANYYCVRI